MEGAKLNCFFKVTADGIHWDENECCHVAGLCAFHQ